MPHEIYVLIFIGGAWKRQTLPNISPSVHPVIVELFTSVEKLVSSEKQNEQTCYTASIGVRNGFRIESYSY